MIARPPSPVFDRLAALADPIRSRVLLVLERHELTVTELRAVLQLPQSTVSRHLKALSDAGWVVGREDGAANRYRMPRELDAGARRLWQSVRDDVARLAAAQRDAERVRGVLAERHGRSQQFFATSAGQWDRLRAELFGARTELYALLGLLPVDAVVGDLGCGAGHLAEALAPFVAQVEAVDESAAMLRAARARLDGLPNVTVHQGTLEQLPLDDASLDVAVLSLVLHYLADPAVALAEARRVLRPGGRLLVVDMRAHDREDFRHEMGHVWLGFEPAQLERWSGEAGFPRCRVVALPQSATAKGPGLFLSVCS